MEISVFLLALLGAAGIANAVVLRTAPVWDQIDAQQSDRTLNELETKQENSIVADDYDEAIPIDARDPMIRADSGGKLGFASSTLQPVPSMVSEQESADTEPRPQRYDFIEGKQRTRNGLLNLASKRVKRDTPFNSSETATIGNNNNDKVTQLRANLSALVDENSSMKLKLESAHNEIKRLESTQYRTEDPTSPRGLSAMTKDKELTDFKEVTRHSEYLVDSSVGSDATTTTTNSTTQEPASLSTSKVVSPLPDDCSVFVDAIQKNDEMINDLKNNITTLTEENTRAEKELKITKESLNKQAHCDSQNKPKVAVNAEIKSVASLEGEVEKLKREVANLKQNTTQISTFVPASYLSKMSDCKADHKHCEDRIKILNANIEDVTTATVQLADCKKRASESEATFERAKAGMEASAERAKADMEASFERAMAGMEATVGDLKNKNNELNSKVDLVMEEKKLMTDKMGEMAVEFAKKSTKLREMNLMWLDYREKVAKMTSQLELACAAETNDTDVTMRTPTADRAVGRT